jgi:transmembrane sensor
MNDWRQFGEEIARAQDALLEGADAVDRARAGFLEQASVLVSKNAAGRRGRSKAVIWGFAAAAAVAFAVATAAFFQLHRGDAPLGAMVDGSRRALQPGEWIASPPKTGRRIDFSDGSAIALTPSSGARIVSLAADGAHVSLERGTARVSVQKRPGGAHWRVDVGPYTVSVKGTRFTVAWEPVKQAFTLSLEEGSVLVRGPLLGDGRLVALSETLRAFVSEGRLEITSNGGAPAIAAALPSCAPETVDETRAFSHAAPSPSAKGLPGPTALGAGRNADGGWRSLAASGRNSAALAAAKDLGLDSVLARSSAADLILLGDLARLAGDFEVAERCYMAVRKRFPGKRDAANAAFALGRLDFDHRHMYAAAAQWMTLYLSESAPDAVLAREALGRLIEAAQKAGDFGRAKTAAQRYLASYPDGPHAELARRIAFAVE